jgi:hypothetical protein
MPSPSRRWRFVALASALIKPAFAAVSHRSKRVESATSRQCLTSQLANERYHFERGNDDEWRKSVKSIAGTLRDTWEIAVEEVVGHVIRRLSNEVKTPGLVKLTAITVPDCEARFGRCSKLLHSAAAALNRPLPRPEALSAETDALAAWADNLRQRQAWRISRLVHSFASATAMRWSIKFSRAACAQPGKLGSRGGGYS